MRIKSLIAKREKGFKRLFAIAHLKLRLSSIFIVPLYDPFVVRTRKASTHTFGVTAVILRALENCGNEDRKFLQDSLERQLSFQPPSVWRGGVGSSKKKKKARRNAKETKSAKENSGELNFRFMLSKRNLDSTAGISIN